MPTDPLTLTAKSAMSTLGRYVASQDARKLDPGPLLELALAGALARKDTALADELADSLAALALRGERVRAEAREELARQESLEDFAERMLRRTEALEALKEIERADTAPEALAAERQAARDEAPDHEAAGE